MLEILGISKDVRTNTHVIYAQLPVMEYLNLVGSEFHEFYIQRKREKHKAYERMKKDIIEGALLPSITLAIKPEIVPQIEVEIDNLTSLQTKLSNPNQVFILDGLQRTYILNDLKKDGVIFKENQKVHLEFWLEQEIKHLIYRIIVLNAGQKPMTMRHQVELLFLALKNKLETEIGINIMTERELTRRTGPKRYSLDRVACAYHCFMTKSPEVNKENIVAKNLVEGDVLDSSEDELAEVYVDFRSYFDIYAQIDVEVCRVYKGNEEKKIPTGANWFGSENVMNAFFAAVAIFGRDEDRKKRIITSLTKLLADLENSSEGDDILGLEQLHRLIDGFNPRKVNIGHATRKLITSGFREFFREEGVVTLKDCWVSEVE